MVVFLQKLKVNLFFIAYSGLLLGSFWMLFSGAMCDKKGEKRVSSNVKVASKGVLKTKSSVVKVSPFLTKAKTLVVQTKNKVTKVAGKCWTKFKKTKWYGNRDEFKSISEVKKDLETLVKDNPRDVELKYKLALINWKMESYPIAAALFEQVLFLSQSTGFSLEDGTQLIDAARFMKIKCKYADSIAKNPQCDPSEVESTLKSCKDYLAGGFIYNSGEVVDMLHNCQEWLFQKYASNIEHYLNRENTVAAEGVLKNLKERFDFKKDSPQAKYLACRIKLSQYAIAQRENFPKELSSKLLEEAREIVVTFNQDRDDVMWKNRALNLFNEQKGFFSSLGQGVFHA